MRKIKNTFQSTIRVLKSIIKMKGDLWLNYKCKILVAIKK